MRRRTLALLLTTLLTLPAVTASAAGFAGPLDPTGGLLAHLWSWLATSLHGPRSPISMSAAGCDHGSTTDPNGRCLPAAPALACDHGSMTDPNGGCVTAPVH